MKTCFLSIEEDQPLGIWWSDDNGCGYIPLDEFLEESKRDMSNRQRERYAKKLQVFIDELTKQTQTKAG